MTFLSPWLLALAVAAAVPLLIHLLRRRIGLQVEFPAARYLARAEREHSRTLKLRNLLLMLLRVIAVLLLALAAARPLTRWVGAGHAPTALAIVVDNGLSTSVIENGAPLLDRFRRMAAAVAADASPDDRLYLVTADGTVRGGSSALVAEEVERLGALAGGGDPGAAITHAIAAIQGSGLAQKQIALLTDGQRTSWREPTMLTEKVPVVVWAPDAPAPMNRAVVAAEPRPVRWTPGGVLATRVLSAESTSYRMALGDRTLARGTAAPNEEATVRATPPERGWLAGRVEIAPDELAADNTRHFAVWIGPPPAVRVAPGAGSFAREAIGVLRTSGRVAAGNATLVAAADEATTLPALLLPPLDPVRIGAANRALERLGIPWRFGQPNRESVVARGRDLQPTRVDLHYDLIGRTPPGVDTLATVGPKPWIVAGPRYVLVGSPLVPEATALPVSASFLPWIDDVMSSRLNAEPGAVREAAPGQRLSRPQGVTALEASDGARFSLAGPTFTAPAQPGAYFFVQASRRVGAVVVNPEVRESMLERLPARELRGQIVAGDVRVLHDDAAWIREAFSGASRRSAVVPLLLAALVILLAESVLSSFAGRGALARVQSS